MEQGRFLCPPTNVVAVMGMMQDCAQHMADRVDLHLGGGAPWDPPVCGAVALERKRGERRWDTNGLLIWSLSTLSPPRLRWLHL